MTKKSISHFYYARQNKKLIEDCDECRTLHKKLLTKYQKRCMEKFGKPRMAGCGSQGKCPKCGNKITIN